MSGLYVQLDAEYMHDPKIMRAGALAELVYVRALTLSKRLLSDGNIDEVHLPLLCIGLPGKPSAHALSLVRNGLWTETAAGWHIVAWEKRNKSSDEIVVQKERKKEAGRRGNHQRWHVDQGIVDPKCAFCHRTSDPTSDRKQIAPATKSDRTIPRPEPEPEPEPYTSDIALAPVLPISSEQQPPSAQAPNEFDTFWTAYPRKVDKQGALRAWKRLKAADRERALAVVDEFARQNRTTEQQFIVYPAKWLSSARWEDVRAVAGRDASGCVYDPDTGAWLSASAVERMR